MTELTQTPLTARDYLELLQKSGLLSERQIAKIEQTFKVALDGPGEDLARQLVGGRVLTPFQAERLLEGRYRGFIIDRFRIREILGVGGMGCVFIAEDPEAGEKVALKVLSSQYSSDAGMLARMKLEAWAGMQVDHPNVVRTRKSGSTGAVTYLVMDLKRAISLHEMVALGGAVRPAMVCDMFRQAALGLQAAHDKNIIHRDIKPANLLIDQTGHTWLLDFGLALVGDGSAEEFSLAMIFGHDCLGTPDYIAPEQSLDSNAVDARADIYSLGCTLYVGLTGRVAFADCKTNQEKLQAQRTRTPPSVHSVNPEVPEAISDVVAKMMAREPADRYQTATEVAAALEPFSDRRTVKFDFRKLITIRARLARQREMAENRSRSGPQSYITSSLSWVDRPSHHLRSEGDTFTGNETPAIRQQDHRQPERATDTSRRPDSRFGSTSRSQPIPRGWYVQSIKSKRRTALKSARCDVGKTAGNDVLVRGKACDDHQCTLEFDGESWRLRQASMTHPTFVNGDLNPYAVLKSGSRLTFLDGSGFVLRHVRDDPQDEEIPRISPWIYAAAVAVGAVLIGGAVWVAWSLLG